MRSLLAAALALILTAGACGGDAEPQARDDPFEAIEREFDRREAADEVRAAPRWERVAVLRGTAAATRKVTIDAAAIQWRARWRCDSGSLRVTARNEGDEDHALERPCPSHGRESFIGIGETALEVEAEAAWRLVVEQQVETPLHEPALAAMEAPGARVVAKGGFRDIERPSRGRARVYELSSGRLALRLTGFRTSANTDLYVWLSRAPRPTTSRQAKRAPHKVLAPLKSTLGDQNYLLPRDFDADEFSSIVIWCEPIQIAYTAAPLREAGSSTNSS